MTSQINMTFRGALYSQQYLHFPKASAPASFVNVFYRYSEFLCNSIAECQNICGGSTTFMDNLHEIRAEFLTASAQQYQKLSFQISQDSDGILKKPGPHSTPCSSSAVATIPFHGECPAGTCGLFPSTVKRLNGYWGSDPYSGGTSQFGGHATFQG